MSSPSPSTFHASGIPPVDSGWGGFTAGKTYLLVGHAKAGRLRLALQTLQAGVEAGESALLVSARTPETLLQHAQDQDFDLAAAYRTGLARLLRVPAAPDLVALGDEGLGQALSDLGDLVRAQTPGRLVVDDFTAFVQFRTFAAFRSALEQLVAAAEEARTMLILGFGAPANEGSRRLLHAIEGLVAGSIRIETSPDGTSSIALVPAPSPAAAQPSVKPFAFTETPLAAPVPPPASPSGDASSPPQASAPPAPATFSASSDGFGTVAQGPQPELIVPTPLAAERSAEAPATEAPPPPSAPAAPHDQVLETAVIQPVLAPQEPAAQAPEASMPTDAGALYAPDTFAIDPVSPPVQDGVEASVIRPIDPAESPFTTDDPFGQYLGPDLLSLGHFVDSDVNGATKATHEPLDLPAPQAAAPAAASPPAREAYAPRRAAPAPPPRLEPEPEPQTHPALRRALKAAFATRNTQAFMVLALRYDDDSPYADLMPAIGEALRAALGDRGVLEADIAVPRTVAFLPGVDGDAAPLLFEAIQSYLRAVAPTRADDALAAINALVVPNGQPFNSANELLAYIFEG